MKKIIFLLLFYTVSFGQIPPDSLIHIGADSLITVAVDSLIHVRSSITGFHTPKPTSRTDTSLSASYNMWMSNGQVLTDISTNTNNGTTFNVDQTKDGLGFDGISSYVSIPDDNSIDLDSSDFSIEWESQTSVNATQNVIQKHITGGTSNLAGFTIYHRTSNPYLRVNIADGSNQVILTSTTNLNDGIEHKYFVSVDKSDKAKLYIDGILIDELDVTSVGDISNAIPLEIGRNFASGAGATYFNGNISDVNIYKRFLDSTEVKAKWNDNIKVVFYESFSDSNLTELARTWNTVSGVFSLSGDTLTASTGGDLTTPLSLPFVDNGIISYNFYDGSWSDVSETVDASSVFAYSNELLTMSLATNERIRNIAIKSGAVIN